MHAGVPSIKGEKKGTVNGTLDERGDDCSLLIMNVELELRRVCKENASLDRVVNDDQMRVKILAKKVNEEELTGMALQ